MYNVVFDIVMYCNVLCNMYKVSNNTKDWYCLVLLSLLCSIVCYIVLLSWQGHENSCTSMADLKNSFDGFAYAIDDSKEGGYVLNITNAAAILVRNEVTGKIEVDLN